MDKQIKAIIDNYDFIELDALIKELQELRRIRLAIDKGYLKLQDLDAYAEAMLDLPDDMMKTLGEIFGVEELTSLAQIKPALDELARNDKYIRLVSMIYRKEGNRLHRLNNM